MSNRYAVTISKGKEPVVEIFDAPAHSDVYVLTRAIKDLTKAIEYLKVVRAGAKKSSKEKAHD